MTIRSIIRPESSKGMAVATVMLRAGGTYKRPAFETGLRAAGYDLSDRHLRNPNLGDVLVLWNRTRGFEGVAALYEQQGATVLIVENGYLQAGREKTFAMALGKHNGAGTWMPGHEPRFPIETRPWRRTGRDILLLPQRGIGSPGVAMPRNWLTQTKRQIATMTDRPIRVRIHPGPADKPLAPDLVDVWACVTWGSGAGIKAIQAGVPVFHDMPEWIGGFAARSLRQADIEKPFVGDRAEMLRQISWAMWRESEVASGAAFRHLLG